MGKYRIPSFDYVKDTEDHAGGDRNNDQKWAMPSRYYPAFPRLLDRWNHRTVDWWLWEMCAAFISLLSLAAIILILLLHNGRSLPAWPWRITINSLVSVFATIMESTMLVSVAAGIGQAKWHWFQQDHSLSDIEVYDQASRGPWGALKMISTVPWRHISTLGAIVMILAMAIDPFVQQVAVYQMERVPVKLENSTIPVIFDAYASADSVKRAIYGGLFGANSNLAVTPYCPSGNCTWDEYTSLGVCSQCADITNQIKLFDSEQQVSECDASYQRPCSATLPNGLSLDFPIANLTTLNSSGVLPLTTLQHLGLVMTNFSIMQSNPLHSYDQPRGASTATECALYWCVNTYTANVTNTILNETLLDSWYDADTAIPHYSKSPFWIESNAPLNATVYYNMTPPFRGSKTQSHFNESMYQPTLYETYDDWPGFDQSDFIVVSDPSVSTWLGRLLSGNSSQPSDIIDLFSDSTSSPTNIFENLAQSLTVIYRRNDAPWAMGVVWENQTIVRVRWVWLSLPCVLLAASTLFFGATVVGSKRAKAPIWKSSSLALVLHGSGETARRREGLKHIAEMDRIARTMTVRLVDNGGENGQSLVERSS